MVQHSFRRPQWTTGWILVFSSPKPTSWPSCTSPSKALYEVVITEGYCRHHHHSAASPSCLSTPSVALRQEGAEVNQWNSITGALSEAPSPCVDGLLQVFALQSPSFLVLTGYGSKWMGILLYSPVVIAIFGGGDWCHLHSSAEEIKEFAEPLCTLRNPDSKAEQSEVAGFGCSPTKKAFPATNLPCKNRNERSLEEGLDHSQAVWGWSSTRVKEMREPKLYCSTLRSFPCTNSWKDRNRG